MKALASSSHQIDQKGQHAGAHSGLTHPAGGPPNPPASAPSGEVAEQAAPALFTRCGWCKAVMVDGPLSPEGLESTGMCKVCTARELARLPKYIVRQEPAGTYRIEDRNGVMQARSLPGRGIALAMTVRLEELSKAEGWCPRHVPTALHEGRCFACNLGHEPSPWAVAK